MKLFDIIKKVGSGIIANVIPGGSMLLGVVNELLPSGSKLSPNATGEDINQAVGSLSSADKTKILSKEFDVEITQIREGNETLRVMLESDANNPQSTRPYIAKHAFHVIAFVNVTIASIWAWGVIIEKPEIINAVADGWPFILAVNSPLVSILLSYFGNLVKEGKNRLDAANGKANPTGIAGIISMFKK